MNGEGIESDSEPEYDENGVPMLKEKYKREIIPKAQGLDEVRNAWEAGNVEDKKEQMRKQRKDELQLLRQSLTLVSQEQHVTLGFQVDF